MQTNTSSNLLKKTTFKVGKRSVKKAYSQLQFLVCTPLFWTAFNVLLMSVATFAIVFSNSVLLAIENKSYDVQIVLCTVVFSFSSTGFLMNILHLWFARFDDPNKPTRLWLNLPLMLFFAAFILHNVFWFLGLKYDLDSFPNPNSVSYTVVGFVMCLLIGFSSWYQSKYVLKLYI